jgi:HlyD family secretion protein
MKFRNMTSLVVGKKRWRRWAVAVGLAGCALVVATWLWGQGQSEEPGTGSWEVVKSGEVALPIVLEGQLEPISSVAIVSAFDGRIVKKHVQFGDSVEAGYPLLEVSSQDLVAELRDAESAAIRARQALALVSNWRSSSEWLNSERQARAAESAFAVAKKKLQETQSLYDKGIVARMELDAAQSEAESTESQSENAQEELATVREKGGAEARKLAQLELENRQARLDDLRSRLDRAVLKAPLRGVVLPAPSSAADNGVPKELEIGVAVTSKDTLMVVGDISAFAVRAALDEFDVLRVGEGTEVTVTLLFDDSIELPGTLRRVSQQARKLGLSGEGSRQAASFDVEVTISDIPADIRTRLRLGMSARITLVPAGDGPKPLLPLAAVTRAPDGAAQVLKKTSEGSQPVFVKIGRTTTDTVEVLNGLTQGDIVWVPTRVATSTESQQEGGASQSVLPGMSSTNE